MIATIGGRKKVNLVKYMRKEPIGSYLFAFAEL